jgi:Protein of unknown function (DUF2591)
MIELEGAQLNAAVATAEGYRHLGAVEAGNKAAWCASGMNDWWLSPEGHHICGPCVGFPHDYCTDWARGGPILEKLLAAGFGVYPSRDRSGFTVSNHDTECIPFNGDWYATSVLVVGPTVLTAAMRAYVASKL